MISKGTLDNPLHQFIRARNHFNDINNCKDFNDVNNAENNNFNCFIDIMSLMQMIIISIVCNDIKHFMDLNIVKHVTYANNNYFC